MAAFMIYNTPPSSKRSREPEAESAMPRPKLVVAPFHPMPEIDFGHVLINDSVTRVLLLSNPNSRPITLHVQTAEVDRIFCSATEIHLAANEENAMDVTWSPILEGPFRKVIHFRYGTRNRSFDVVVRGICDNYKSKSKGSKMATKKQVLTKTGYDNKTVSLGNTEDVPAEETRRLTYFLKGKENISTVPSPNFKTSSPNSNKTFSLHQELLNKQFNAKITNASATGDSNVSSGDPPSIGESDCDYFAKNSNRPTALFVPSRTPDGKETVRELNETHIIYSPEFSDSLEEGRRSASQMASYGSPANVDCLDSVDKRSAGSWEPDADLNANATFSAKKDDCDQSLSTICGDLTFTRDDDITNLVLLISPPRKRNIAGSSKVPSKLTDTQMRGLSQLAEYSRKSPWSIEMEQCGTPRRNNSFKFVRPLSVKKTTINSRHSIIKRKHTPKKYRNIMVHSTASSVSLSESSEGESLDSDYMRRVYEIDPFMKKSLCHEEGWIDSQEKDIIKWLNSILTPPVEMENENGLWKVDAAKLWTETSRNPDSKVAPSKDNFAASLYSCPQRLDVIRRSALNLLNSKQVRDVLGKLAQSIDKKVICIRDDRDLHVDQGLRFKLNHLLWIYNPLWLRLGLETIYNQHIPKSKAGITEFIQNNLFKTDRLGKKTYNKNVLHSNKHPLKDEMKKFILNKFMTLVYFLDKAKMQKLIRHDTCLFLRNSEQKDSTKIKSSQDMLLAFCGDLVVGHGDIIRQLKFINYKLEYKQTYVEEYDFRITGLNDLRDGVALTRVIEILLNDHSLSDKLRVPPISLLQKNFNISLAITALESKFKIEGDISAKDIAGGHREKMLSLLWQMINNYLAPRYNEAATKIQKWWRKKLFKIYAKKATEKIIRNRAAIKIQAAWRGFITRKRYLAEKDRMILEKRSVVKIQKWFRACVLKRKERLRFLSLKNATIIIQRHFRANLLMRKERGNYLALKSAVRTIENAYKGKLEMRKERRDFLRLRSAALFIQRKFVANKLMKKARAQYVAMLEAVVKIKMWYRATKCAQLQKMEYVEMRNAAIKIQRWYGNARFGKQVRKQYLLLINAVLMIQRKYRQKQNALAARNQFLLMKKSTITLQRCVRLFIAKCKAQEQMKIQRECFLRLKKRCVFVQRTFRANRLMKVERQRFFALKEGAIAIQRRFRAKVQAMRENAAITIQRRYRAMVLMRRERKNYVTLRENVVKMQILFRSSRQMKIDRAAFLRVRNAAITIQRRFIAKKLMIEARSEYARKKQAAIAIQNWYRSVRKCRETRSYFLQLKYAATAIQRRYRQNLLAKEERRKFLVLKNAAILIQRIYRLKLMKRRLFDRAATLIQAAWRGYMSRKRGCHITHRLKNANVHCKGTLGERYRRAIMLIQTSRQYTVLSSALTELDLVSSFSSKLCIDMINEGLLDSLFRLLAQGNRSEPSLELYNLILSVLITLCKYNVTKPFVWAKMVDRGLESDILLIVHLMKITHEKSKVPLMVHGTTLLWLFAQDEHICQQIAGVKLLKQQLMRIAQDIKRKVDKNPNLRNKKPTLPKVSANWLADPKTKVFDDSYYAITMLYQQLYPGQHLPAALK